MVAGDTGGADAGGPGGDAGARLEAGLVALDGALAAGREPSIEHALGVLEPFGALLLEGSLDGAGHTATALDERVAERRATWSALVITAAAARVERFHGLLDDPASAAADLEAARVELEGLFAACDALGEREALELRDGVAARDDELERRLG